MIRIVVPCLAVLLAACSAHHDDDSGLSMRYDAIPCGELVSQRAALTRAEPSRPPAQTARQPLGIFAPRGTDDRERAYRTIDAMTRSMERRDCGKEQAAKPPGTRDRTARRTGAPL